MKLRLDLDHDGAGSSGSPGEQLQDMAGNGLTAMDGITTLDDMAG